MSFRTKSRPVERPKVRPSTIGKQETNRRLVSLGLSRHDDPAIQDQALAIVARFLAWIRQRRCVVSGKHSGQQLEHAGQWWRVVVQPAHLAKRGAFAPDFGNVVPLVDFWHRVQEHDADFFRARGLDELALARRETLVFFREHPKDAAWLLEHANDGDVLELARQARTGGAA